MIDNNSEQLEKLINEIEGRLNDFDAGITEKDETIKSFAELVIGCVETAVNKNTDILIKTIEEEIGRLESKAL